MMQYSPDETAGHMGATLGSTLHHMIPTTR
jgi:hypothetical protein